MDLDFSAKIIVALSVAEQRESGIDFETKKKVI